MNVREEVLAALGEIAPELDGTAVAGAEPLQTQLELDSMDFLDLLVAVAERTGVNVPESDYNQVTTLDDCVAYVEARVPAG